MKMTEKLTDKAEKTQNSKSTDFSAKLSKLFKNDKLVKIIVGAGLALIVLIFLCDALIPSGNPQSSQSAESAQNSVGSGYDEYEAELEKKLAEKLSAISGTGSLSIAVTLESTAENVFSERGTDIATTISPKVRGVLVVCAGGNDVRVKQKIVEAVTKLFGIGASSVCVTY